MRPLRVLNIEDSERDHELFRLHMVRHGVDLTIERVETASAMEAALGTKEWDVIICDYSMPRFSAPEALEILRGTGLDIPFIIISGTVGEEAAVNALKAGANDYLMKDNLVRLVPAIEREMQDAANRRARSQAEIKIRESEARFRSLFEAIPQPVWVYDRETLGFLKVNDAAIEQYGYSRDEFMSMTIKDIRLMEQVPALVVKMDAMGQDNGYQGIWEHIKKDGTEIDVEVFAHTLQFEGRPARLVLANDVTERRSAEQELVKSEERYRDLVENAHDIIYSHDLRGNYTSINKAGELITGYTREEALTMNISQIIAPEFVETANQMMEAKFEGKGGTAYELDILAKDGRRISVEVNTKLTYQNGVPVGVQGIARDITARKRLEEQLLRAQKLESVGRLAGGIAHDFNNMLTAINGYSDLTLRKLPKDHELRRNIEEIKKAGERSAMLTNQLLAFSRRQVLRPEIIDLNDVITDTSQMLERVIGEDIGLITKLDPKAGSVKVDPGQLSQIIMNLAVNSRDAMPEGGRLTIATSNVLVKPDVAQRHSELLPGSYVKLSVSDTGIGIKEEDRSHIFEPFFTTKETGKGTGLGLATVYGIVTQSGGSIIVSSEIGAGTEFEIYLPRVEDESQQAPKPVSGGHLPFGPETILLVEDEALVRSLLRELLEACGYNVIEAPDGPSAISICDELSQPIDLVITDVVMPQMSGRELAKKLGERLPNLPILFVSGYTDDSAVQDGILDADVNFIQKPFTLESISRKVREILDAAN